MTKTIVIYREEDDGTTSVRKVILPKEGTAEFKSVSLTLDGLQTMKSVLEVEAVVEPVVELMVEAQPDDGNIITRAIAKVKGFFGG